MLSIPPHTQKIVIGVLTPRTGGFYYGAVVNGVLETVRRQDAIAVAFETSRLNLLRGGEVLGASVIDGWLAVNEFSDPLLLAELRRRGAPVVHLHSKPDIPTGATVSPDNEGGARAITEHLLSHGHRDIAFAGNLGHLDIAERYAGYRAALNAAGVALRDDLIFDTPHHKEEDGHRVARTLIQWRSGVAQQELSGGAPVTALVAGTDRLALGAMSAFLDAGIEVPDDFAIVGFDDADAAQFAEPPLTTVKQSFTEATTCAVTELIEAVRERRQPRQRIRVPAQPIIRRSCGCDLSHSAPPRASRPPRDRAHALAEALLALAGKNHLKKCSLADWPEAEAIARLVDESARVGVRSEPVRSQWWAGFLAQKRDAESLVRVMELLESTLRAWTQAGDGQVHVRSLLRELRVALMHQWQRSERVKVAHYESVTEAAYRLAGALSRSGPEDPSRDLRWIRWSSAYHACCALWVEQAQDLGSSGHKNEGSQDLRPERSPALCLTGEYSALLGVDTYAGGTTPISPAAFPPRRLLETASSKGAIVSLASVARGRGDDYGLLAVVAPLAFEHLEYVGTPGDWAVQLGAALDRLTAERELRASAELDSLTGLANRSSLLKSVEQLRRAVGAPPFAVLLIDLDDFKKVNDSLGHEAGDLLIVQLAERLTQEVQVSGGAAGALDHRVARVGGDEFAVLLEGVASEEDAVRAVQRIQERLKQPYVLHGRTVFVSASIGVNFGRGLESSAQELLRDADTAMYRAKTRGLAHHEIFHRGMHAQALEKLHLDARLRLAIEHDELELWYQPIIDLSSGSDIGAEALIRWRDPEQGLLLPGRFLPVAEDVGLAIPISEWVIRRACAEVVGLREVASHDLYVNVNVPADHIKHPGFVDFVREALEEAKLPPRCLGIEIVESTLLDEPARCAQALSRLRALGVRIAIDDFGTGYSNLSYLRDFPVNTLKIDRDFVKNVPGNGRDNGIARAIIAMGQELGLNIVAEGIETRAQFEFLKESGCEYGQGFLMSVPLEVRDYLERLSQAGSAFLPTSGRRRENPSDWPDVGLG